jgi:thiol:disulfide interchange protein
LRTTILATLLALLAGVGLGLWLLWTPSMGGLDYVEGSAAGLERARRDGKPALFFFSAGWCGACRQMADSAFRDERTLEVLSAFTPVLVDADSEEEFAVRATVHGSRPVDEFRRLAEAARDTARRDEP